MIEIMDNSATEGIEEEWFPVNFTQYEDPDRTKVISDEDTAMLTNICRGSRPGHVRMVSKW